MADKLSNDELEAAYQKRHLENWPLNWRAWGSWFSWGSPVGLGLFFIELAGAAWILFHL